MSEKQYCLDADMGMGHMCVNFDHGLCHAEGWCERKGNAFDYKWMVLNDFTDVEKKLREEFKPFFDAMISELIRHYPRKGESWRYMPLYDLELLLSKHIADWYNKNEDTPADIIDIANLQAMVWSRKNGALRRDQE